VIFSDISFGKLQGVFWRHNRLISLYLYKMTTFFNHYRSSSDKILFLKLATVSNTILNFVLCDFGLFLLNVFEFRFSYVFDMQNIMVFSTNHRCTAHHKQRKVHENSRKIGRL